LEAPAAETNILRTRINTGAWLGGGGSSVAKPSRSNHYGATLEPREQVIRDACALASVSQRTGRSVQMRNVVAADQQNRHADDKGRNK
jgi:hypothetical protein